MHEIHIPESAKIKALLIATAFVVLLFTQLQACRHKSLSPTETVKAYVAAIKEHDAASIETYLSRESVDKLAELAANEGDSRDVLIRESLFFPADAELSNEKITGDRATVDASFMSVGQRNTQTLHLIKEGGDWKLMFVGG